MNFDPQEIEALREMQLADLARLESLGAHCLEIGLNRQVYWTMVTHLQRERAAEALQQALIQADAPFEMMQTFFGLSSREYTRLRRVLDAAPAVVRDDDTAVENGPGALQGQAWLTLQTHHAQRLLRGRPAGAGKPAIIGLFGFADRLRGIWQGARLDDPYADWWLLKTDDALVAAERVMQAERVSLAERLAALPALEVTLAESQKPSRTPLRFANPYAFRGARLLGDYDGIARGVLTGAHVGLMDTDEAQRLLGHCAGKLRGVFCVPQGYRFLGIDRLALAQGTAKAELARKAMGAVPEEILSGERRPPFGPRKAPFAGPVPGNPVLDPVLDPGSEPPASETEDAHAGTA